MGDVLRFIKPVKRPHPLFEAYWDFWNPYFSWQELMAYNAAIAELTADSTDGDAPNGTLCELQPLGHVPVLDLP